MNKRILLATSLSFLFVTKLFADSGFANQRFLDNADQFDPEEGVRTHVERVSPQNEDGGAVVDVAPVANPDQQQKKPKRVNLGSSFSDIASDIQTSKKPTASAKSNVGLSFGDLAKSARSANSKQVVVSTRNVGALQRLFPPEPVAAPQSKQQKAVQKKVQWGNEL